MKHNKLPLVLLFSLLAAAASAQDADGSPGTPAFVEWPNALGIYGSSLAGHPGGGLQWQRWFGRLGTTVTAGGVYAPTTDESWGDNVLDYSAIAQLQYRVYGEDFARWISGQLYLWAMAGHLGYIERIWVAAPTADNAYAGYFRTGSYKGVAVLGAGIGIESILFRHFSLVGEFGYMGQFPEDPALQFGGGAGLRYRY